jgi:hypothetical protein
VSSTVGSNATARSRSLSLRVTAFSFTRLRSGRRVIVGASATATPRALSQLRRSITTATADMAFDHAEILCRARRTDGGRFLREDLDQDVRDVVTLVRERAGQALVEHDADRPHVGRRGDVDRALHLLGRHVVRSADHLTGRRVRAFTLHHLRDAEVEDLGTTCRACPRGCCRVDVAMTI